MRARLPWRPSPSDEHPAIEPLEAADAHLLRLPWLSRFSTATLANHLAQHQGHSLWVPSTGEYAVAAPWRGRSDIAQAVEITARRGKVELVHELTELIRKRGYKLFLLSDEVWSDDARLYSQLGFRQIERIVFFNRELRNLDLGDLDTTLPHLDYSQATVHDLDLLIELDHGSFPWLWWNSPVEFETYIQMPDVHVCIASHEGRRVGYTSFTIYKGWAHLDRLAVVEGEQGKGFGAAQLHHVLTVMQSLKAASVNLSTQEDNVRSHRLYKSFGFRQTTEMMGFYGREL